MNNRFKILKNNRVSLDKTNFILFDCGNKTRSEVNTTINGITKIKDELKAESICPLEALRLGEFKEVKLGEFIPLPFEKADLETVNV